MNNNGGTIRGQKFPRTRPSSSARTSTRSYAANHLLFDDYFFSSMSPKDGLLRSTGKADVGIVVRDFFEKGQALPNERYRPYLSRPATDIVRELVSGGRSSTNAHKKAAGALLVDGGFNINSVSVDAGRTCSPPATASAWRCSMAEGGKPTSRPRATTS